MTQYGREPEPTVPLYPPVDLSPEPTVPLAWTGYPEPPLA